MQSNFTNALTHTLTYRTTSTHYSEATGAGKGGKTHDHNNFLHTNLLINIRYHPSHLIFE